MNELSIRFAIWLQNEGIGKGDIVTLCSPRNSRALSVLCAAMYLGATFNAWKHDLNISK